MIKQNNHQLTQSPCQIIFCLITHCLRPISLQSIRICFLNTMLLHIITQASNYITLHFIMFCYPNIMLFTIFSFVCYNQVMQEVTKYLDNTGAMPINFSFITFPKKSTSNNKSRLLSQNYQNSQVTSFCTQFFINSYLTSSIRGCFHYLNNFFYYHYFVIKEAEW